MNAAQREELDKILSFPSGAERPVVIKENGRFTAISTNSREMYVVEYPDRWVWCDKETGHVLGFTIPLPEIAEI